MPIALKKFSDLQKPLEDRILEYLQANQNSAFAMSEIVSALEGYSEQMAPLLLSMDPDGLGKRYQKALSKLVTEGRLEHAEYQGATYYALPGEKRT